MDSDLAITDSLVHGSLVLAGASVAGRLGLRGSAISNPTGVALSANELSVTHGAYFDAGFTTRGAIRLNGARIGGHLDLTAAELTNEVGAAFTANNLAVGQNMACEKLQTIGEFRIHGARIGGRLLLDGAQMANPDGRAMSAEGLTVERDVLARNGFSADGEVRLLAARVTGQIEIAGRVESRTDHAFMADLLVCSDLRTPARFDLTGAASLRSARVAGVISFQDVTIHSAASVSLDLFDLEAGVLRLGGSCAQTVNLAGARVNTFETLYVQAPPMHLRGLTYRDLQDANVTIASRLKWLRADPLGFEPQPYEQLAKYYHDLGREREARIVLLYKRRRNSRLASGRIFPGVSWWHRLASFGYRLPGWLFDALAGYGYVPSHALAWLATAWCAGFLAFRHESIAIPSNSANINAALYSLYALAPASPLGLEDKASLHGAALVTLIVLQITGYALFAAVVPAITRALSRGAKQ